MASKRKAKSPETRVESRDNPQALDSPLLTPDSQLNPPAATQHTSSTPPPAETESAAPEMIGAYRNRVKELRYVRADQLERHAHNWRQHPESQASTLRSMLDEVGFSTALIAYQSADGSLRLIDGHLRADTVGSDEVPVLILDVTDEEANKLLLTMDPLSQLAETNQAALDELMRETTASLAAAQLITELHTEAEAAAKKTAERPEITIQTEYLINVTCDDEDAQAALYEQLTAAGYKCRCVSL